MSATNNQDLDQDSDYETPGSADPQKSKGHLEYQQTITIEELDYQVLICNHGNSKGDNKDGTIDFSLTVVGHGNEYRTQKTEKSNRLEILKNAFRGQLGLGYLTKILSNGAQLELKVVHPCLDPNVMYILERCVSDFSFGVLLEQRVKKLESQEQSIYPITEKMLGSCITITQKHKMSPAVVYDYLSEFKTKSQQDKLPHNILDFYTVKYLYQEEPPIPTKNQVLIKKIIKFEQGDVHQVYDVDNGYTLLSRRYGDDVIGTIVRKESTLTINLGYYGFDAGRGCNIKTSAYQNGTQGQYCDAKEYFKSAYLLTLPFQVDDGFGWGLENRHTTYSDSSLLLIKDNRLYQHIAYCKDDKYSTIKYGVQTPLVVSSS